MKTTWTIHHTMPTLALLGALAAGLLFVSCGGEMGECCEICTYAKKCNQNVSREECDAVIERNKKISGCNGRFYPY